MQVHNELFSLIPHQIVDCTANVDFVASNVTYHQPHKLPVLNEIFHQKYLIFSSMQFEFAWTPRHCTSEIVLFLSLSIDSIFPFDFSWEHSTRLFALFGNVHVTNEWIFIIYYLFAHTRFIGSLKTKFMYKI